MTGENAIVLRIVGNNAETFFEHATIEAAKAEAHRLTQKQGAGGAVFAVYVPLYVVQQIPQTTERATKFVDDLPF